MKHMGLIAMASTILAWMPRLGCAAQSLADINLAVHVAFMAQQAMLTDNNNLLEMRLQMHSSEKDAVDALNAAANDAFGALDEAVTIGQILHQMTSADDQGVVRGYFVSSAASFVKTADADIESINFAMDKITTAEARTEAKRIRDKLVEAANALRPFTTKTGG